MDSKIFYGKPSSSTVVEHEEDGTSSESEFSDGDIYEPDQISSSGDSSADDATDLSDDETTTENDDLDTPAAQSDWKPVAASARSFPFTRKEEINLQLITKQSPLPIDIFNLFVSDEIIEYIVAETNKSQYLLQPM